MSLFGNERHCAVCGKEFLIYPDWAYKKKVGDGDKVFCSWGCMRAWEAKRKGNRADQAEAIRKAIQDGLTVQEITALLSVDRRVVIYWEKKLKGEKTDDKVFSQTKIEGG